MMNDAHYQSAGCDTFVEGWCAGAEYYFNIVIIQKEYCYFGNFITLTVSLSINQSLPSYKMT